MEGDVARGSSTVGRGVAAADHGELRLMQYGTVAEQKQHCGGPGNFA